MEGFIAKIALAVILLYLIVPSSLASTAIVVELNSPHHQSSIKEAIKAANNGDTILIKRGTYFEHGIEVSKTVSIQGEEGAIVDGEEKGEHLFIIKAPGVTIRGMTLQRSGVSYLHEVSGVRVINSDRCLISNNFFYDVNFAIYLENAKHCRIESNKILGKAVNESSYGNGIHVWTGEGHQLIHNKISHHRDGIYLEFAEKLQIEDNVVTENIRYGLHFMNSNNNKYLGNIFSRNNAGAAVMYSKNITMINNRFERGLGTAAYGLLLKDIKDSLIENNHFYYNTVGIYSEGSNRCKFIYNKINGNGFGLKIFADSEDNFFTKNIFSGNSFDVASNSEDNPNIFSKNFWSQYDGYDLDHDGIGDRPYRAVNLSAVILESTDSSFILTNSFLFSLLDAVERAFPELIPIKLADEHPIMYEKMLEKEMRGGIK